MKSSRSATAMWGWPIAMGVLTAIGLVSALFSDGGFGDMLAWGGRLLAPEGTWLALKGRFPNDELAALPAGFRVENVVALDVPGLDAERHVIVVRREMNAAA